jgi:hypothetical protein
VYPALLPLMPHTSAGQQLTELTSSHLADLNGLSPFCAEDEIWFLRMCRHISTGLYNQGDWWGVSANSVGGRNYRQRFKEDFILSKADILLTVLPSCIQSHVCESFEFSCCSLKIKRSNTVRGVRAVRKIRGQPVLSVSFLFLYRARK